MKLSSKTLILIAGTVLCASCSSFYSKHAKHSRDAGMNNHPLPNAQRYAANQQQQQLSAQTHGVNLAKRVDESDNAILESDESDPTLTDEQNQERANVRLSAWQADNKCMYAKPIGGNEQHYFFNFDRSSVSQADQDSIRVQAQYLLEHPNAKVRIEGNADDRGSREYNIALAARRAKAIIKALKAQGVKDSQCTMVSYGAEKPAAKGETEEAYHCNRRVDIVYEGR